MQAQVIELNKFIEAKDSLISDISTLTKVTIEDNKTLIKELEKSKKRQKNNLLYGGIVGSAATILIIALIL